MARPGGTFGPAARLPPVRPWIQKAVSGMTVQHETSVGTDAGLRDLALRSLKRKREFAMHLVSFLA